MSDDPARAGFDAVVAALQATGELVRDPDRGVPDGGDRAHGYAYAGELLRLALDLYADADGYAPRFVPFSTPTPYHAGDRAVPRVQGGANPDGLYDFAALRSDCSYRIRGRRGNDCYLSFSFSGGRPGEWPDRTAATLNDRQMEFAPDGTFEVVVSADPRPGNWVRMEDDMCSVIVRQYFREALADRVPATMAIEVLDQPPGKPAMPEEAIGPRLAAAAAFIRSTNAHFPLPAALGENTFTDPLGYSGEAGALGTTDNVYCMGRWRLEPHERLVVETTPVPCGYWSLQAWNRWGQSLAATVHDGNYRRQVVNMAHADLGEDGLLRVVLAHHDPGEANWLDPFGWTEGTLILRYLYPEERPARPQCRLEPER